MKQTELTLDLRSYSRETRSHQHDYHQLVLPVTGDLVMSVDTAKGEVSSRQAVIVAAGTEHSFAATENNCFVVADIPAILAPQLERLPAFIHLDKTLAQYVIFLYQYLNADNQHHHCDQQMLLLLIQLLEERFGNTLNLDKRIDVARRYLDQNYHRSLSLGSIATVANLSQRQLNTLFREQVGMTMQQYLIEKRMQKAWQLLEQNNSSVQHVADKVGYGSLSAFSDRFRKHFGQPPSYFRKNDK